MSEVKRLSIDQVCLEIYNQRLGLYECNQRLGSWAKWFQYKIHLY